MFDEFIDKAREDGLIRVLSSQDAHELKKIEIKAVITRTCQFGVLIQDKASGKSWMIEVDTESDIVEFSKNLTESLFVARKLKEKFNTMLETKTKA